ncbi:MAG: DUF2835 domain-containing protein [Pontibacterium sp.]
MKTITFDIQLPADEFLKLYQGVAKSVLVTALDGRTVRFPAEHLRPYLMHSGIYGRFTLFFDAQGKFVKIQKHA